MPPCLHGGKDSVAFLRFLLQASHAHAHAVPCIGVGGICYAATVQQCLRKTGCQTSSHTFLTLYNKELHVMIPGDTFLSELAPRQLSSNAGWSSWSITTAISQRAPDPSFVIVVTKLRVGPSRSVASAQSSQSHCLYTLYARAGKQLCTSPVISEGRRIYNDFVPYVVPLLARAGVLLCEPPKTVGKATWAGLRRRLG